MSIKMNLTGKVYKDENKLYLLADGKYDGKTDKYYVIIHVAGIDKNTGKYVLDGCEYTKTKQKEGKIMPTHEKVIDRVTGTVGFDILNPNSRELINQSITKSIEYHNGIVKQLDDYLNEASLDRDILLGLDKWNGKIYRDAIYINNIKYVLNNNQVSLLKKFAILKEKLNKKMLEII